MHGSPWVFPYVKRATVAIQKFQVGRIQGERYNFPPLRANEFRNLRAYVSALVNEQRQLDGLPAVGVDDVRVARHFGLDVWVDGFIAIGGIPLGFIGTVLHTESDDLFGDVVAEGGRTVVLVVR